MDKKTNKKYHFKQTKILERFMRLWNNDWLLYLMVFEINLQKHFFFVWPNSK